MTKQERKKRRLGSGTKPAPNPLRPFGLRAMSLDQVAHESAEGVPAPWRVSAVRPPNVNEFREEQWIAQKADQGSAPDHAWLPRALETDFACTPPDDGGDRPRPSIRYGS